MRLPGGPGVRVDTHLFEGYRVPPYYDSMIAKLIVHGKDRLDAITKMRAALNEFVIRGIHSNIPFQAALMQHPRFISGDFNTGFIAEQFPHGFRASDVKAEDPKLMELINAKDKEMSKFRISELATNYLALIKPEKE
jgi:propionyl-CoA carboxylase alpha chain